jgi:hypothetical protein
MATDDQEARSAAGRALAALRPTVTGTCDVCGTPFTTIKAGRRPKRFCSTRCQVRAWRAAKRAEQAKGD